ncbi:clp protease adapter protein ClpF, chloroplastic-like isoform X3 [Oryza glaberrima]|uniref:clp protease adapter protein ClpF, chloroplastic-like isoform X3 n=1 Tax=Oryza glaberrima TaxID=4538 RepID=UPI00224C572C|nr:clp protease adapter protein ClpF, chloroplastic-like isoform X3 [Oryza glaberrima]
MQGIFACGSISSAHGSCFRPACLAVDDLRLFYKINSVTCGAYSWRWCVKKLHMRTNRRQMGTTVRTNARWLFGGDGRSSSNARMERSESANEDILIFYFQLDLQTRIQYALNIEQFDVAKQLREKLTEIETVIIRQREAKRGSSKTEAQDKAINLLRVRADLQKAVDSENYALAAALRDEIAKLETESLAVSAKALAYQNMKYAFRLGQKVRHKVHVAEENLAEAEIPEKGRFDHPYIEFLFFGEDTAGDFIPIKQLREKYDQPRYEASGDEDDDDGSTDS